MYQVLKRDGGTVEFEISKISAAMIKAFEALEKQYHPSVINMLALQVSADFEPKIKNGFVAVAEYKDGEIMQIGSSRPQWLKELMEYVI